MNNFYRALFALFVVFIFTEIGTAQICIPLGGSNPSFHIQNFDGLGNSSAPASSDIANINILQVSGPRRALGTFNNAPTDGGGIVNVPGWALFEEGTAVGSVSGRFQVGTGSSSEGNGFSYASATAPTDRAFGSQLTSGTHSRNMLGGCFENTHTTAVNRVRIYYTGEMYRRGSSSSAQDTMFFEYGVNATNIFNGTFTPLSSLNFSSPNTTGIAGERDGNDVINKINFPLTPIDIVLNPGDRFYVRWVHDYALTAQHDGLAIDDVFIQFLHPTAAPVTVSGRVTDGLKGLSGVAVVLQNTSGTRVSAITNPFGYYSFSNVASGQAITLSASSKTYTFVEPVKVINLNEELSDVNFEAVVNSNRRK